MAEMERFNPKSRKNEEIHQESLSGERALYRGANLKIYDTVFHDGESPSRKAAISSSTAPSSSGNTRSGTRRTSM